MMRILKNHFLLALASAFLITFNAAQAESKGNAGYSVIHEETMQNVKRSIDVRLEQRVSEAELKDIAQALKNKEKKRYKRTFISYYLTGMEVGAGAWATTHYNPGLEVKILGVTAEAAKKASNASLAQNTSRDTIGVWLDDRPYIGATVTIYRESSKLYVESKFKDGSTLTEEVNEIQTPSGTKLVKKGGNPHGEYRILDKEGNLQAGGDNGIFLNYIKAD